MSARRYPMTHLRQRLAGFAINACIGLVLTAMAAGMLVLFDWLFDDTPVTLRRLAWIAVAVVGGLSLLSLALSGILWLVYRRRRAKVD